MLAAEAARPSLRIRVRRVIWGIRISFPNGWEFPLTEKQIVPVKIITKAVPDVIQG
jgi:hypothetical protein